ncbi:MAG: hypothetical protein KDA28_11060, partial [Phycisphaerales bacterium]|nr:hypothetical protein [Phycisphaerales bacterium]
MLKVLFVSIASTALAQGPVDDPGLHDASVDDVATEMEVRRDASDDLSPVAGSGDLSRDELRVPTGSVLPEGTFLVRRHGLVLKAPTGEWIFVPTLVKDEAPIP